MRFIVQKWLGHYLPLWLPLSFVFLPLLFVGTLQARRIAQLTEWAANLSLGFLSFWSWAIITNAYTGRLAAGGGTQTGTVETRKAEFPFLLFSAVLTAAFFLCCHIEWFQQNPMALLPGILLVMSLSIYALGVPR